MPETETPPPPSVALDIVLLPSDRFFVRAIPLAGGAAVESQVELALESLTPFPVGQLYYGYRVAPDRTAALVFAAYRKRFAAEEIESWEGAVAVLPAFLVLLGSAPAVPGIRLWIEPRGVTVAAWDGRGELPLAVLARETEEPPTAAQGQALVEEIRFRAGLGADASVQEFSGAATLTRQEARGIVEATLGGAAVNITLSLSRGELNAADVRDKGFLAGRRAAHRRDVILWRSFVTCLGTLAALLLLEGALVGGGVLVRKIEAVIHRQAPDVQKIRTAESLSTRIDEMTSLRLMPFEMLVMINQNRPNSIRFLRVTTNGLYTIEVEAQTSNAADVDQYNSTLRASQQMEKIEIRDLRSTGGVTSFVLAVTFRQPQRVEEGGS